MSSDFYSELLERTDHARRDLLSIPLLQRGARGAIDLDTYIAFLTQAYHHVKHTLPLLMACGARLPERLEWLRAAMGHYIEEETGHQEWILDDIKACGADAEAVRAGQADVSTELMVAYAYDTIQRGNPVGFLGMVLVLEGTSIRLATDAAQALRQSLGLPKDAFRYLTSHGALDISHMEFYQGLVNRLDQQSDREEIVHRANVFYRLYGDIFRGIANHTAHAA